MLITGKFTGPFSMNASPLIAIILIIEESFKFVQGFCLPYFLREHSTEQRHLNENYCEGNCFVEFVFWICTGVTFLFPESGN